MAIDDLPVETWRGPPSWLVPGWTRDAGVLWESWSTNGEACIGGLERPFPGGVRLAHCLTWILRSFASYCRCTYNGTGALAFAYHGAGTPTTLARSLFIGLELALHYPELIRRRVRHRGGDPKACRWPGWWLEGATSECLVPGMPIPRGRAPRQKLVILAEEQQVTISARQRALPGGVRARWSRSLEVIAGVDESAVLPLLAEDEPAFLASVLVLVHAQPAGKVSRRPPLEASYARHASLLDALSPTAEDRGLPVGWHALWRLPPAMLWDDASGEPWMRYPAVSFVVGGRRLGLAAAPETVPPRPQEDQP